MEARELLERDEPVEVRLPREVDRRHPAAADLLQQLVPADALEDQRHPAELSPICRWTPPGISVHRSNDALTGPLPRPLVRELASERTRSKPRRRPTNMKRS